MEYESIEHEGIASNAGLTVVGVGGGGGNAVKHMIASSLRGVSFICANTDLQALKQNGAPKKIQLGERLTKGLGAGAKPDIGFQAAQESLDAIKESLSGADMVFVTAGMGGGTGTGAAPVIAQIAKSLGALTVGVVTKPFAFEGTRRMAYAEAGIAELRQHVDCLITIPNDRLLTFAGKKHTFAEMMKQANDILYCAVKGISDVIMIEGFINLDFADVRTTMRDAGLALMGTGIAKGEDRARKAALAAISSPLLEDVSIEGAKAVLYNITATEEMTMDEVQEIGNVIGEAIHPDAEVLFGAVYDEKAGDELRVTVIATGIEAVAKQAVQQPAAAGKVTPFSQGGKVPPAQTQQQAPPLAAQSPLAASVEGTSAPRRRVDTWYDEKSPLTAQQRKLAANRQQMKAAPHAQGEDFIYDDEEAFDIPAFIRRSAD